MSASRTAARRPKRTVRRARPLRTNVADSRASRLAGLPFGTGGGGGGGGAAGRSQPAGVDSGQTRIDEATSFIAPRSAKNPVASAGAHSSPESAPVKSRPSNSRTHVAAASASDERELSTS